MIILLNLASSSVSGFEYYSLELMKDLKMEGVSISKTTEVFEFKNKSEMLSRSTDIEKHKSSSHLGGLVYIEESSKKILNHQMSPLLYKEGDEESIGYNFDIVENLGSILQSCGHFVEKQYQKIFPESSGSKNEKIIDDLDSLSARQHSDVNSTFYLVICNDLPSLKEMAEEQGFYERVSSELNANGANVILFSYLLERYDIGHWLVETFPEVALKPYSGKLPDFEEFKDGYFTDDMMPYTGENILHMVIVRRNYKEVRWLLDFFKDHKDSVPNGLERLLTSNATGGFFNVKGDFYFGGYPLQFAVCSNSIEIFDLVLSFASSIESNGDDLDSSTMLGPNVIFMRDSFGNTVLHLCVIHCLQEMFEHVYKTAENIVKREMKILYSSYHCDDDKVERGSILQENLLFSNGGYRLKSRPILFPDNHDQYENWLNYETKLKMDERLMLALNADLHSPLTLAASRCEKSQNIIYEMRKADMLRMLLRFKDNKILKWTFGPIESTDINLDGLLLEYDLSLYEPEVKKDVTILPCIKWLCLNEAEIAISIPEITLIIENKWEKYGLPIFQFDFTVDMTITALVTLISIFINITPTFNPSSGTEVFVDILYVLLLVIFFLFLAAEMNAFIIHRHKYFDIHGVAIFHVYCKLVKMISFFAFVGFKISVAISDGQANLYYLPDSSVNPQDHLGIKLSIIICIMVSWVHMYYYLIGFKNTGPFTLILIRIMIQDVPYFLQFFSIILFAFATPIAMVANSGDFHADYGFWNFFTTLFSMIQKAVIYQPSFNYPISLLNLSLLPISMVWLQDVLITFYYSLVVLVMINLLIAIMSTTYHNYSNFNDAYFIIERFNIMVYLKRSMAFDEYQYHLNKICKVKSNSVGYAMQMKKLNSQWINEAFKPVEIKEVEDDWLLVTIIKDNDRIKTSLFIIDPQIDFHPGGSLAVPGANEDSERIASMIMNNKESIHEIFVSLDSHFPTHIAHAIFWEDAEGNHPAPFTVVNYSDVRDEVWIPVDKSPEVRQWCLYYTKSLERKGKFKLTIWPEHCIIGSRGHCIVPVINKALQAWAEYSKRPVNYIMKGQNCRTEMFSALVAEVEDPLDSSTSLNHNLLSMLRVADRVSNDAIDYLIFFNL